MQIRGKLGQGQQVLQTRKVNQQVHSQRDEQLQTMRIQVPDVKQMQSKALEQSNTYQGLLGPDPYYPLHPSTTMGASFNEAGSVVQSEDNMSLFWLVF